MLLAMRTLVPQRRLLLALGGGAVIIALAELNVLFWLLAAGYHAVLVFLVTRDLMRLPGPEGFEVRRDIPRPLSLGEEQPVLVGVSRAEAAGLRVVVADHVPAGISPTRREVGGSFDRDGVFIADYPCRPTRRGAFDFGPCDIRCWRAGGFFARQVRLPARDTAAVYPNVLAIRRYQLTARRGMPYRPGLRRSRPPGATSAFAGLRDFLPGDELRRINWKASARKDLPVVNELEAERGQQVMILLDCGRLMTAPAGRLTKLDHAVNAALLLGWLAQQQGDRVGLLAFNDAVDRYLPPQRGPQQVSRLSQALYAVRAEYVEPDFGEAFALLNRRVTRRSLVVVLTDVLDPTASRDLVAQSLWLSRRHLVLVVAMADPAILAALMSPVESLDRAYEWAAAEELAAARRQAFEQLRRGGVLSLDVEAGKLSPALVERYLEMKERALL